MPPRENLIIVEALMKLLHKGKHYQVDDFVHHFCIESIDSILPPTDIKLLEQWFE